MPKQNVIIALKGDNLELLQWYKHLKNKSEAKIIRFFGLIFEPIHKVITNSVINKICNENKNDKIFAEITLEPPKEQVLHKKKGIIL